MSDMNTTAFTGRLAQDPEARTTPSGIPVTDFVLANNVYRGSKEQTLYLRCACWNKTAEFAATLKKGDHISVTAQLADDNYTPEGQDKPTRGRVRLEVKELNVLHRKNKPGDETAEAAPVTAQA